MFEVVDPEGASVGTFATNSKGQIVIPLTLAGNYTVYECEAPNGYLLSEEPAQNVKVEYGKQATVTFENAPYGNLMVKKYSDSGMQRPVPRFESSTLSPVPYIPEKPIMPVLLFSPRQAWRLSHPGDRSACRLYQIR